MKDERKDPNKRFRKRNGRYWMSKKNKKEIMDEEALKTQKYKFHKAKVQNWEIDKDKTKMESKIWENVCGVIIFLQGINV
jgi:hypothetical protein